MILRCSVTDCRGCPQYSCDLCGEMLCSPHMQTLHGEHLCDTCHEFERQKAAQDAFEEHRHGCLED